MKSKLKRWIALLLSLVLTVTLFPFIPTADAALTDTVLYQLPSRTLTSSGIYRQMMSYVIKTRRGQIIVIDGGYETDDCDALYLLGLLQDITGDEIPNVDAWFITHPHADHYGAMIALADSYTDRLTVENFYWNFPSDEQVDTYCPSSSAAGTKSTIAGITRKAQWFFREDGSHTQIVEVTSKHTDKSMGSFDFDSVHIDILATCDDVFWAADTFTDTYSGNLSNNGKAYSNKTVKELLYEDFGNNTSLVFRATVCGKSILFLGDAAEPEGIVLKYFHDQYTANNSNYYSLKSDYVQMAHHGQNGVAKNVYVAIAPKYCLWPTPDWVYTPSSSSDLTTKYTKQWVSDLGATSYVSKDGLKSFTFSVEDGATLSEIPEDVKALVFDAEYYAARYSDLYNAFGNDEEKLYNHFLNHGIREGRCASLFFDVKYYANQNSQKMLDHCKGDYKKAMNHFISYCTSETELSGAAKKLSHFLDCKYYKTQYPELVESYPTELALATYFKDHGFAAGQTGSVISDTVTKYNSDKDFYHAIQYYPASNSSCTSKKTEGYYCNTCMEWVMPRQSIAGSHSYTSVVTPCNCTQLGYTTYTCTVCGHSYKDTPDPFTGDSTKSLYFGFTNDTDRYTNSIYGNSGANFDTADAWWVRAASATNNGVSNGALSFSPISNEISPYIQTLNNTPLTSDTLNFPAEYAQVAQIRLKFSGMAANGTPTLKLVFLADDDDQATTAAAAGRQVNIQIPLEYMSNGEYFTATADVSDALADSTTITSVRICFALTSVISASDSEMGSVIVDYLYVGSAEDQPLKHYYQAETTPPTCSEAGYTTHTCHGCGDSYQDSYVSATGHSYSYTCNGAAHTQTCANCGDSYTEAHSFAEGVCVCGAKEENFLHFKSATVTLESDLSLNYYVAKSALEGFTDPYATFQKAIYDESGNVSDYEETTVTEYAEKTAADGTECYVFTFTGISAKEMSSAVSVALSGSYEGTVYSGNAVSYSVKQYAENLLAATEDAALRTLLVDMLNYGAEAQIYFAYNTANLANADLTEEQKAWASQEELSLMSSLSVNDNEGQSICFESAALLLEEKVTMHFYLDLDEYTGTMEDLYAKVFFENAKGELVEYTIEGTELTELNGDYVLYFDGLNAAQMRSIIGVELYSRQTASCISPTLYYSIESYAHNKLTDSSLNPLVTAMMRYGDSVAAYAAQ